MQKTHGLDDAGAAESSFEIRVSDRGDIEKRDLDLTYLKQRMAVAQKQLQELGVDEIMCLLKNAAETWTRDQRFAEYLDQGLSSPSIFRSSSRKHAPPPTTSSLKKAAVYLPSNFAGI